MKTLLFCNLVPTKFGAYEQLLVGVGQAFRAAGDHYVIVFAGEPVPELADRLRSDGVCWHVIEGWSDGAGHESPWAFCRPALRLLRKEAPNVAAVHFGNELPSLAVRWLDRWLRGAAVRWVWEQDQQIRDPSALGGQLSRVGLVGRYFDRLLAVYDGGRESFMRRGVPSSKIEVIYNAVADYTPEREPGWLRRELGVRPGAVLLLATAWLVPRKRVDFLLRAVARVAEESSPALHLAIIGGGPERERLESVAVGCGLCENVSFLGHRQDVRDLLPNGDVFVHASLAETCTYAVTEAMCVGLPVVMTESGAAREQVLEGRCGYVVDRDDFEGFCNRLSDVVNNPDARRRMGKQGRERWLGRYQLADAARRYHAVYRDVVAGECVRG